MEGRPKRIIRRRLTFPPDDTGTVEKPLTKSEKRKVVNQRYREKIKKDPELYAQVKAHDKEWQRRYRLTLSAEKRATANEKARLRNIAYRQRQKEMKKDVTRPSTRLDAKKLDERREKNRLSQQKRRQNMSSQKKRREREAQLVYYHHNKVVKETATPAESAPLTPVATPSSKPSIPHRSTISRLKKRLGGNLLVSLKGLVKSVNKKSRPILSTVGITYKSPTKTKQGAFIKMPSPLKKKRDKHSTIVKRFLRGLPTKGLYAKEKKHASLVTNYFNSKSNFLPGKRGVTRTLEVKKGLDTSIAKLHQDFIQKHGCLVSRATFFRHRPKNIISFSKTPFRQCLCEICLNPMLKVKVLNSLGWPRLDSLRDVISLTLCNGERRGCLDRTCYVCGVQSVDDAVNSVNCNLDETVSWQRWERVKRKNAVRVDLIKKEGCVRDIVSELKSELLSLPLHDFIHRWQARQYTSLVRDIPEGWAVAVLDFSENYLCVQQDQPQSAYFGYSQVTVHPCVLYYGCSCGLRVTDNWTFLSDVLLHSADMVHCLTKQILTFFETLHLTDVVLFSDGCASQYKSRTPFSYLQSYSNYSFNIHRCFFGARHGKNPCDALGGLLKQAASRSVRARNTTIQSASDLFRFAAGNLTVQPSNATQGGFCTHLRRRYSLLTEQDINDTALSFPTLRPLQGTRKIHYIWTTPEGLLVRNLCCFCPPCRSKNFHSCCRMDHVDSLRLCDQFLSTAINLNDAFLEDDCGVPVVNENVLLRENVSDDCGVPVVKENVLLRENVSDDCGVPVVNENVLLRENVSDDCGVPVVNENVLLRENVTNVSDDCGVPSVNAEIDYSREIFFIQVQALFCTCTSFDELHMAVKEISPTLLYFTLPVTEFHTISSIGGNVDTVALRHFASMGIDHLFPLETVGDGNCVPRALSLHCFGNQEHHLEMRVRIVHEMVSNAMDYLCLDPDDLSFLFCHSDYQADSPEAAFRLEALNVCKSGIYMGMWQLMAAANALNVNILSVYPSLGPSYYRSFYNRSLKARHPRSGHAFALFWSSTEEHEALMPSDYWTANHVVPLLAKEAPIVVEIDQI